jgi:hypothetical protein
MNRPLRFSACGKIFDVSYVHMLLIGLPDAYAQKRQVILLVHLDFKRFRSQGLWVIACWLHSLRTHFLCCMHVDAHVEIISSGLVWGTCKHLLGTQWREQVDLERNE